jgi:uncharacterized phage protein (TIGR02218 family)
MKTCSGALKAHLQSNPMSLAFLWKIKRTDGTILGFTTFDSDISYDDGLGDGATNYLCSTGFLATANSSKSDLSVDNSEAAGFLESNSILESDIRAGLYDDALIWIRVVNWADLTMGDLLLRTGTVGQVKMAAGAFQAEIRGLCYKLSTVIGSLFGPICRSQFGSGANGIDMQSQWLCMVDVTAYAQTGYVSSVPDALHLVPLATGGVVLKQVGSATPTAAAPADWFDDGYIEFTSGALDGQAFEIRSWDGTTLTLYLPLPAMPAVNDTFSIEPGCDHTVYDCNYKFGNIVNFHGEPFMPGMDSILNYPNAD